MYCWKCGNQLAENTIVCDKCGSQQQSQASPMDSTDPAMHLLLPIDVAPKALIAGYLGLFALILLPAPLALLFGILALRDLKANPKLVGKGRAIFGIIMGSIFSVVLLVVCLSAVMNK